VLPREPDRIGHPRCDGRIVVRPDDGTVVVQEQIGHRRQLAARGFPAVERRLAAAVRAS
jgi:hypothetical protein